MPVRIGFHASHEQFAPSRLLRLVQQAEAAGFDAIQSSDHIEPWGVEQGNSGFAFAWLGAAMQATSLPFTVVNAPGDRYHPAIVAQAAATLAEMFPGRFSLALGSGEAMNEHITGNPWPPKSKRTERLGECVSVIRRLFDGERVTHEGLIRLHEAKVWSLPAEPPPLIAAALSPETAAWAGSWADGMITVNQPEEKLRQIVGAFEEKAGPDKPLYLQVHLAWGPDEQETLNDAHRQWRGNSLPGPVGQELKTAEQFDLASRFIAPEDLRAYVDVGSDLGWHVDNLARYEELGFDTLYCHNVCSNQEEFVDAFGEHVLPQLSGATI